MTQRQQMRLFEGSIKIEILDSVQWTQFSTHFDAKNDYSMAFLSIVTACWTLICMTAFKSTLQRYRLPKIVIYVQTFGSIKEKMFHCTHFLPYTWNSFKNVCYDFVLYDEHLERIYQKWKKKMTLTHSFAYSSPRASFTHAGTHLVHDKLHIAIE